MMVNVFDSITGSKFRKDAQTSSQFGEQTRIFSNWFRNNIFKVFNIQNLIQSNQMSFNIFQNVTTEQCAEKTHKFPKVGSNMSVKTETDCYLQNDVIPRKISREQKETFIDMIINHHATLKQASRVVGMSYSTAKKVFSRFRYTNRHLHTNKTLKCLNEIQCGYSQRPELGTQIVAIISTVAGRQQLNTHNY